MLFRSRREQAGHAGPVGGVIHGGGAFGVGGLGGHCEAPIIPPAEGPWQLAKSMSGRPKTTGMRPPKPLAEATGIWPRKPLAEAMGMWPRKPLAEATGMTRAIIMRAFHPPPAIRPNPAAGSFSLNRARCSCEPRFYGNTIPATGPATDRFHQKPGPAGYSPG